MELRKFVGLFESLDQELRLFEDSESGFVEIFEHNQVFKARDMFMSQLGFLKVIGGLGKIDGVEDIPSAINIWVRDPLDILGEGPAIEHLVHNDNLTVATLSYAFLNKKRNDGQEFAYSVPGEVGVRHGHGKTHVLDGAVLIVGAGDLEFASMRGTMKEVGAVCVEKIVSPFVLPKVEPIIQSKEFFTPPVTRRQRRSSNRNKKK